MGEFRTAQWRWGMVALMVRWAPSCPERIAGVVRTSTLPLARRVTEWPTRSTLRSGPGLAEFWLTMTVDRIGWPVAPMPPTMKMSPFWSRTAL